MHTSSAFTMDAMTKLFLDATQSGPQPSSSAATPTMTNPSQDDFDAFLIHDGEFASQSDFSLGFQHPTSAMGGSQLFGDKQESKAPALGPQLSERLYASLVSNSVLGMTHVMGQSPDMATPYLDSCTNTPFTPATTFTPSLNTFQASPYFSPYIDNDTTSADFRVANYLDLSAVCASPALVGTPWVEPVAAFNGDPNLLLLDKNELEMPATHLTDEADAESSDHLFPPLSPENGHADLLPVLGLEQPSSVVDPGMGPSSGAAVTDFIDSLFQYDEDLEDPLRELAPEVSGSVVKPTQAETTAEICPATVGSTTIQVPPVIVDAKKRKRDTQPEIQSDDQQASDLAKDKLRRFECDICHTKFNRRYNLKTHMKTHNKERTKAFSCTLCTKAFDRKHDRERHIATVHYGERSFVCNECGTAFSRKDALTRHLIQKHGHDPVM